MTLKTYVNSTLTAAAFLTAVFPSVQAAEITSRLYIRYPSTLVSFDDNIYTVTYTPDIAGGYGQEPFGAAAMVANVDIPSINNSIFRNNALNSDSTTVNAMGGALALINLNLQEMKNSQFINNTNNNKFTTTSTTSSGGGALALGNQTGTTAGVTITDMDSCLFRDNAINGVSNPIAGAVFVSNFSSITHLNNTVFDHNTAYTASTSAGNAQGGAIFILGKIDNITNSTFQNNRAEAENGYTTGGAISNQAADGNIKLIDNTKFIGNTLKSGGGFAYGGAIASMKAIEKITNSTFSGNIAETTAVQSASGGALYIMGGGNIDVVDQVKFSGNRSVSAGTAYGGAVSNAVKIGQLSGVSFSQNIASGNGNSYGGAIYNNGSNANLVLIDSAEFDGNQALSATAAAAGGAVANFATIGKIRNASFRNNQVQGKTLAYGGAVYTNKDLTFEADNYTAEFSGNTAQTGSEAAHSNAVYAAGGTVITLNTLKKGRFVFDDALAGGGYALKITGDGTGRIDFNHQVAGTSAVEIANTAVYLSRGRYGEGKISGTPSLSLDNGSLNLANGYLETIEVGSYTVQNNSYLHMDVHPATMEADKLIVNGNVNGVTQLVIHADSDADIRNKGSIVFASSTNDSMGNADSFRIFRVFGSPYLYDVVYSENGTGKEWKWEMNGIDNPDQKEISSVVPVMPIKTAPEVTAYRGVVPAALEQTRSLTHSIRSKISADKIYSDDCRGFYDEAYNGSELYNAWVNPVYFSSTLKDPVRLEADIWGLEAGFDLQHSLNHKLGLFASYRRGDYDLNGEGKRFYATVGSNIDIDSYIGGLYYRYDQNSFWTFATVYGGIQKAELKTDDGVKSDTDGTQLGAAVEVGKAFALTRSVTLEPEMGVFYTQIDFDDINDGLGKTAGYDTIRQTELEAGIRLEKTVFGDNGVTKFYFKPGIVQPFTSGDSVLISGLGKVNAYDDTLLGRGEAGLRGSWGESLSAYFSATYTFGRDYRATAFNAGLNYAW